LAQIAIVSLFLFAGGSLIAWPAMAAYLCPSCYGLERVTGDLLVDSAMPAAHRTEVRETIARAAKRVSNFYGSFDRRPTLMACETDACDRRLGGRGQRATTFGTWLIRVSPRGLNETILAHEFSHVEFHARIGDYRLLTGSVPAWFDEGLAVIVANDARFVGAGATSQTRCLLDPGGDLPSSPFRWADAVREAGRSQALYARAACRVMQWMEANGGTPGLLAVIRQVENGTRRLP
jgi:hypothetical protein